MRVNDMRCNNRRKSGFTLIEILVVLAIASILMGLILWPVTKSFEITRSTQASVDAQDAARAAITLMSRDLGQAMYVYDNSTTPMMLPVRQPDGTIDYMPMPCAMIAFVLPRITMHCNAPDGTGTGEHPSTASRDYPRNDEAWPSCPVCDSPDVEARPDMPMQQDETIVMYFLGLKENNPGAANFGWVSPYGKDVEAGTENQVVLYRAEFSIYNTGLFPANTTLQDALTNFKDYFYSAAYYQKWSKVARVIGIGKYQDLVIGKFDSSTNDVLSVSPTVTYRTEAVENDTFTGTYSSDKTFEYPNAVPAVYTGNYGYWVPPYQAVVYRDSYASAYVTAVATINSSPHLIINKYDPIGSAAPEQVFDITAYQNGTFASLAGSMDEVDMAFSVDPNRGQIDFAMEPPRSNGSITGPVCEFDPIVINDNFKKVYNGVTGTPPDPGSARRYALLATFDSNESSQYLPKARVVPGSEKIVGPNMTSGANCGNSVRYERVPINMGQAGLNQYMINYDTGDLYFSRVYGQDLPETGGKIQAYYKIQFNHDSDVVKGDYSTKALINIHLGMRMFDPDAGKAHAVDLTDSIKIRNALR